MHVRNLRLEQVMANKHWRSGCSITDGTDSGQGVDGSRFGKGLYSCFCRSVIEQEPYVVIRSWAKRCVSITALQPEGHIHISPRQRWRLQQFREHLLEIDRADASDQRRLRRFLATAFHMAGPSQHQSPLQCPLTYPPSPLLQLGFCHS